MKARRFWQAKPPRPSGDGMMRERLSVLQEPCLGQWRPMCYRESVLSGRPKAVPTFWLLVSEHYVRVPR